MPITIFLLTLGAFALGTDVFIIGGILPNITSNLGVPIYYGGTLVSVFAFTYAIGAPILASLTAGHNRKTMLMMSLGSFTLANGISALAPGFDWLLASRVLAGIGSALFMPNALATAVALVEGKQRGRALAWVTGGLSVAIVVGVPIGTWLSGLDNWRYSFWFVASLGLLAFLGSGLWVPRVASQGAGTLGDRLRLLKQKNITIALLQAVLWIGAGFTVYTYISPLLTQITHMGINGVSTILLLFGASSVVGNIIGGYSTDHLGAKKVILIALPLLVVAFMSLNWTTSSSLAVAINVVFWGIGGGMLIPTQQHRLFDYASHIPTMVFSLNGSATYLGIGLGAIVGSIVVHGSHLPDLGLAAAGLVVLALASVLWIKEKTVPILEPEQVKS